MIEVVATSKISNRIVRKLYTARQLLENFSDEEDLVIDMTDCGCQPIGETNVVDCNCDSEWTDYECTIGSEAFDQTARK